MKLIKFMQTGECNGSEFCGEIYINVDNIFRLSEFINYDHEFKFPPSTTIYFRKDDKIRVDGNLDEIIEKIKAGH